ncbi:MAG: hypothetical protein ACP5SH_03100 [Syntrophobacteraceae bacterium]
MDFTRGRETFENLLHDMDVLADEARGCPGALDLKGFSPERVECAYHHLFDMARHDSIETRVAPISCEMGIAGCVLEGKMLYRI